MQRVVVVVVIALFYTTILACSPKITPDEAKVLVSLDEIQRGVESNIDYNRFVELLKITKAEIGVLKKNDHKNSCFIGAIDKCYASYEIARKAWKKKLEAKDDIRKADMDLTLSFSLSFAALNIEKANNCYK